MKTSKNLAVADRDCPLMKPGSSSREATATYCRLPNGRVLVPDRVDRRRFCLIGDYEGCPIFRRYAEVEP